MGLPIDILSIEKKGSVLLNRLVAELHHVFGLINMTPNFVDNPTGKKLRDLDVNIDRADNHLCNAIEIISIIHEGGFIKEKGG